MPQHTPAAYTCGYDSLTRLTIFGYPKFARLLRVVTHYDWQGQSCGRGGLRPPSTFPWGASTPQKPAATVGTSARPLALPMCRLSAAPWLRPRMHAVHALVRALVHRQVPHLAPCGCPNRPHFGARVGAPKFERLEQRDTAIRYPLYPPLTVPLVPPLAASISAFAFCALRRCARFLALLTRSSTSSSTAASRASWM